MLVDNDLAALGLPPAIELKRDFRDAYERRAYLRACVLGKRLLAEPVLIKKGRTFLDRFVKPDPHQQHIHALWTDALGLPVEELVLQLLSDDARGETLRETAPVFIAISADEIRALERSAA